MDYFLKNVILPLVIEMAPLSLGKILKGYERKWVALSDDNTRVFGAGESAKEALKDAESKGFSDVTLMYVQPLGLLYCGTTI